MHLAYCFHRLAQRYGDRIALVEPDREWSYKDFVGRIHRVGNALLGIGLNSGERVAILHPDTREYLEAEYGTMAAGLIRVPLDPGLSPNEMAAQLSDAGARAIIFHRGEGDRVLAFRAQLPDLKFLICAGAPVPGAMAMENLINQAPDKMLPGGSGQELASLNYTGGTTGQPKAVMLSHGNLVASVQNVLLGRPVFPGDTFLNVRPIWPISGILVLIHLLGGARVVLAGRFEAARFCQDIEHYRVTATSLVPTQLIRLIEHLESQDRYLVQLRTIDVGGAALLPEIFQRGIQRIGAKLSVLYGLTEAPWSCYLSSLELRSSVERRARLVRSVGRELFGCKIAILDDGDTAVRAGVVGEIGIRGAHVMQGYWKQPQMTADILRQGWLHTGDLGYLDEEGYLFITGRKKEIIRSGGKSILPHEVEQVLLRHPAVAEAAVIGVPDVEWGETVKAIVVLRKGAAASAQDLITHCQNQLASFKKPRVVEFCDALPKSHYGKVLKRQLS